MERHRFDELLEKLREFPGIEEVFLLDQDGNILHKSEDFQLSADEAKRILESWKNHEGSLIFQGARYAMLKSEELQLAAKNMVGGKGNVVGSITKEGDYLIAHTREEGLIILEWSIFINKVAWS